MTLDPNTATTDPAVAVTPSEIDSNGHPLAWPSTSATAGAPTVITVAVAESNYPSDVGVAPSVTGVLDGRELGLLHAAEHVWEKAANIQFDNVPDVASDQVNIPDIRVGLSALGKNTTPDTMGFIGYTHYHWNNNATMLPDAIVTVEDPTETAVTVLANGDLRYDGFSTTMFQDFIHELGHAIGLAHNTGDPSSIMAPIIGSANPLPDAQDLAGVQALYGAPTQPLTLASVDATVWNSLVGSSV